MAERMSDFRSEAWSSADGKSTAIVDVRTLLHGFEYVEVSYDLLSQMLTELGYTKAAKGCGGDAEERA